MWKPKRDELTKPGRRRLDGLALAILEQAAAEARTGPIERQPAHRLALAWLAYTDIASPHQATSFWHYLGHTGQYAGDAGAFYRQSDPKWMLKGWRRRSGG